LASRDFFVSFFIQKKKKKLILVVYPLK